MVFGKIILENRIRISAATNLLTLQVSLSIHLLNMSNSSSNTSVSSINKWVTNLANININELHPKISCEFLMVVEESTVFTKMVKMITFYSSIITGGKLIIVGLKDVYEFVNNRQIRQLYWDDEFFEIVSLACAEAELYLDIEQPIPVDLLIKLIKLKIISVIKELIFLQRKESVLKQQKNYFKPTITEGEAKGKGKGKGKGSKKEKTDKSNKSKSKKGARGVADENPCLVYQYLPIEEIIPDENIEISGDYVYIALVGFYHPSLLPLCYFNGIPLKCIVKFGEIKYKHNKFSTAVSLDSIYFEDDTLILPDRLLPKQEIHKKKEHKLSLFWQKINLMYKTEKSSYVKDSFIMLYSPLIFSIGKKHSKVYFRQCEQFYEDFLLFVQKLDDYKRYYNTYLESLKIYNLEIQPKKIEVHQTKLYKNALDAIPTDIINVGLILDNLIKEIICQSEESVSTVNVKRTSSPDAKEENDIKKQSYHFQHEDLLCHRSLQDQLKKILTHFKVTGSTFLPKKIDCVNKSQLPINDKPYIIHESNFFEMSLNYYKFLPNTVLDTMISYLKKYRCINALINLPPLTDETISRNKKEIGEWCTLLGIDEIDLNVCLCVILTGLFVCSGEDNASKENINQCRYIPVQTIVHEIQANIPNRRNRKEIRCIDQTNTYEKTNPYDFKWIDQLPPAVALQELSRASDQYEFIDWRYVELFDLMLYRFHHDVDDFGIATRFWKETIRSPVSFNDFMTYVLHREIQTVTEQNEKYKDQQALEKCVNETIANFSDFSLCSEDFILPGSLKDRYLHQSLTEAAANEGKIKKSKDKKSPKDSKGGKTSSKSTKKSAGGKTKKGADTIDARAVIEDEPLKPDFETFPFNSILLNNEDRRQKLNAVDFNGLLLTSSGISTSFYSEDDLKVIVDQFQICDQETNLSSTITLNGHELVIHRTSNESFSFLVNFKSGGVLACGKPNARSSAINSDFYLLTEESEKLITCTRSLFNTHRNVLVTGGDLQKVVKSSTKDAPRESIVMISNNPSTHKSVSKISKTSMFSASDTKSRFLTPKPSAMQTTQSTHRNRKRSLPKDIPIVSATGFVNEVKSLKKLFTPKFKVCSSKLHQYNFIRRVVMPIELDLNEIIRFVIRAKRENKRRLTMKKRYKIKTESRSVEPAYEYDFRVTLPSGLHLRNVVGEKGTYICQYYFQQQALCWPTFDEEYRLHLGNGVVAVKRNNGSFIIYAANGEIIEYETVIVESSHDSNMYHKSTDSTKAMQKFLKHIRRNIYNLTKGNQKKDNFMSSRRMWKKEARRFKCKKPKHSFSGIKFSFTTSEGKVMRYENAILTECEGYYVEKEDVLKTGQVIFRREDGTVSILTDEGHMQTLFPDGTKITVWCEIDSKYVTIDLTDVLGPDYEDMGSFVKIVTCYQYEHPYYITVLVNGSDEKMMLRIASGEIFDISKQHFLVGIDEWSTLLANKEIIRFVGTPCDECGKYCECDLYIKQLYDLPADRENDKLLLKVRDTYNKSFILHYDGSIEKNEEFIRESNKCGHASHKIQPSQAFFTLNRDFSGCMFWTEDDYNKRLSEANDPETDYLVLYVGKKAEKILTTEWRIFEKQHYNFRFVWPQVKAIYENEIEEFDISTAAFVKQRIVRRIPPGVVRNLLKIINDNTDVFTFSINNINDMQYSSPNISLSPATSEDFEDPIDTKKVAYEKKIKKRNMECMDVADKIIEYFVRKTGRYYRSKVYEDFCGVKLMLDDEEEIFFLANFDASVHTPSTSDVSKSSEELNKIQSLSHSTDLMKSKLSKSTSAVETAVEIIKRLEIEKQKGYMASIDHHLTGIQTIPAENGIIDQFTTQDSTPTYVPMVRPLDKDNTSNKNSHTKLTGKKPSILKSPRIAQEISSVPSPLSDLEDAKTSKPQEHSPAKVEIKLTNENEVGSCNESAPDKNADSSIPFTSEPFDEKDINETLNAISQTLRRIRREKFGNVEKESDGTQTESESLAKRVDTEVTITEFAIEVPKRKCEDAQTGILPDLFYIPRTNSGFYATDSGTSADLGTVKESVLLDKCYSNFSLRDVGMADYLTESEIAETENIQPQEEEETSSPINVSRVSIIDEKFDMSEKLIPSSTFEKNYLKIIHESDTSHTSDYSSIQESPDTRYSHALDSSPSMIPLVNVKSLTQYYSDLDLALKSVVSFVSSRGRTPSMRVLRSMSQIEKEFELVIVEHAGVVTDKRATKEVQTDIVFDESDDASSV